MEKFKTVLNIANKQSNLGFGIVALMTAGGEQIFSSVAFKCPCNELNFFYGMVFLLVPALALLLLGYILSKKTWKLLTGFCYHKRNICRWKYLASTTTAFFQITATSLVAPSSWIAVALLNGNYFECAMTGTNMTAYNQHVCSDKNTYADCMKQIHKYPCERGKEEILLTLRAQSQILGWLVIASLMLTSLMFICLARLTSPISYLQLKFWREYAQEEHELMDVYTNQHAKALAERNLKTFFHQTPLEDIVTPSNKDWQKISTLYKFSPRDHFYSTLHQYVETNMECDGRIKLDSIKSNEPADNPAVLDFIDGGIVSL